LILALRSSSNSILIEIGVISHTYLASSHKTNFTKIKWFFCRIKIFVKKKVCSRSHIKKTNFLKIYFADKNYSISRNFEIKKKTYFAQTCLYACHFAQFTILLGSVFISHNSLYRLDMYLFRTIHYIVWILI